MERHVSWRLAGVAAVLVLVPGCSESKFNEGKAMMEMPINCATAQGDVRMLRHEKAHVQEQILAGVESILPASAVVGVVTGKEGENLSVTTGEYNKMIDQRIAEIRAECRVD